MQVQNWETTGGTLVGVKVTSLYIGVGNASTWFHRVGIAKNKHVISAANQPNKWPLPPLLSRLPSLHAYIFLHMQWTIQDIPGGANPSELTPIMWCLYYLNKSMHALHKHAQTFPAKNFLPAIFNHPLHTSSLPPPIHQRINYSRRMPTSQTPPQ